MGSLKARLGKRLAELGAKRTRAAESEAGVNLDTPMGRGVGNPTRAPAEKPARIKPTRTPGRKGGTRDRSDTRESSTPKATHTLTEFRATQFVKLIHAGLPPPDAVAYIIGDLDDKARIRIATDWCRSELLLAATRVFTDGVAWEHLDKDARLTLAQDKFLAEQAYYLYTHSYHSAEDRSDIAKLKYAYDVISKHLDGVEGSDDPTEKFLRDLVKDPSKLGQPFAVSIPAPAPEPVIES